MSYRLPARTTTTCSSAGCGTAASYRDSEPGERDDALAGWLLGPETATCPSHGARPSVLHFAA